MQTLIMKYFFTSRIWFDLPDYMLCVKMMDSSTFSFLTCFFLENGVVGDCPSPVALLSRGKRANAHPTLPFQTHNDYQYTQIKISDFG